MGGKLNRRRWKNTIRGYPTIWALIMGRSRRRQIRRNSPHFSNVLKRFGKGGGAKFTRCCRFSSVWVPGRFQKLPVLHQISKRDRPRGEQGRQTIPNQCSRALITSQTRNGTFPSASKPIFCKYICNYMQLYILYTIHLSIFSRSTRFALLYRI